MNTLTHPIDEHCLDELDQFDRHLQTDWDEVVEEDDEREEVETEVVGSEGCNEVHHRQ